VARKTGPYSPEERKAVLDAVEAVASGARTFRAVVSDLSRDLDRSERGVALLMGRMVRRARGSAPADPPFGISPRLANLLHTIKTLSRRRGQLVAKRDALSSQIAEVDRRLSQLTPRLMALTGLPAHVVSPEVDDQEGDLAGR